MVLEIDFPGCLYAQEIDLSHLKEKILLQWRVNLPGRDGIVHIWMQVDRRRFDFQLDRDGECNTFKEGHIVCSVSFFASLTKLAVELQRRLHSRSS